jgi:uncharacterized membrane protein
MASVNHDRKVTTLCSISGRRFPHADLTPLEGLRPSLLERIRLDHPELGADALISREELARYRALYLEELLRDERGELTELDREVAESIARHETLSENIDAEFEVRRTLGERISDQLANFGGSWIFILLFMVALAAWIAFNQVAAEPAQFDPFPYILLNLILSCVAALQAPIIMMSQKRQEARDRLRAESDYRVNLKAELEIRHLHEKIDYLMSRQWQRLAEIQQLQLEAMQDIARPRRRQAGAVHSPYRPAETA